MTTHKRLLVIHGLKGRMHWKAPSVRENGQPRAELSNSLPAINSAPAELVSLLLGRHAMLYGTGNAFGAPT